MSKETFGLHSVVHKFIEVDRLHHFCVDSAINSLGLNLHRNQHAVLCYLKKMDGAASQKSIADEFGISSPAVAVTLKNLEKLGYIERSVDSGDTRRNTVMLSAEGQEVVKKTHSKFEEADSAMMAGLSEQELRSFREVLDKMMCNLNEYAAQYGKEEKR